MTNLKIAYPDLPYETQSDFYSNATFDSDSNRFNLVGGCPWAIGKSSNSQGFIEIDTGATSTTTTIDHFIAKRLDITKALGCSQIRIGSSTSSRQQISDISGLKLWLDSSSGVTADSSGNVSAWADRSTSALSAAQSTAANKPVLTRGDNLGNFLTYSEAFDNAIWVKTNTTVTADSDYSVLDSALVVDSFLESAAAGFHVMSQSTPAWIIKSKSYRFSFYASPKGRDRVRVSLGGTAFTSVPVALFNVSTGLVESSSNCTATIASAGTSLGGNIYYRCTITMNADLDGVGALELGLHDGASNNYTGTAGLGVYLFGAHFSETVDSTTYLKTTTAAMMSGVDGFPSLFFNDNASAKFLDLGNPSALQITGDITVFAVVNQQRGTDGAKDYHIYDNFTSTASGSLMKVVGSNLKPFYGTAQAGANTTLTATTALTSGTAKVLTFTKSGTTGTIYQNGSSDGSGTVNNPVVPTANTTLSKNNTSLAFVGKICEILVFNVALSGTDRAIVEAYLKAKYTDTPLMQLSGLAYQSLVGTQAKDYINTTISYSGTNRYFWFDWWGASGNTFALSKFFLGSAYEPAQELADYKVEMLIDDRVNFESTAGDKRGNRVRLPRYRFTLIWDFLTDDKIKEFVNTIVARAAISGFFLYTSTYHDVLDSQQLVYCKLLDWQTEQNTSKVDLNRLTATFEEYTE